MPRGSRALPALLAGWLGAATLFAAVVAPAAFAVLPTRSLAGALVGRVLPTLFIAGLLVALASIWLDRGGGGRLPRLRRASLIVLGVSCAIAQFAVAPRIERARADIGAPIEQLAADDPRRSAFGRLHAISVAWLGLAMLSAGATVLLASLAPRERRNAAAESLAAATR
jgi:hypothetical protein